MTDRNFLQKYLDLVARVDREIQIMAELHGDRLRCAPGCSSCCTISSVLPLEATQLRQAIKQLDGQVKMMVRDQADEAACPLLADGLCVVYSSRPLICRTHGLPIAYVDYERQAIEVSACPVNFAEDYDFDQDELFFIDPFNGELARLNEEYCVSLGISGTLRVPMRDLLE